MSPAQFITYLTEHTEEVKNMEKYIGEELDRLRKRIEKLEKENEEIKKFLKHIHTKVKEGEPMDMITLMQLIGGI